jgi:HEAT repeat protein
MATLKDEDLTRCINALKDRQPAIRVRAVRALGRLPADPTVVRILTRAAEDRDELVRRAALEGLGNMGPQGVAALASALGSSDYHVRRLAATALARLGSAAREAVPALSRALRDADTNVRRLAARTLGLLGAAARPAIPALTEALRDPDRVCCRLAAWTLTQSGPGGIAALEQALFSGDEHVCSEAVWALGQAGPRARPAVSTLAAFIGLQLPPRSTEVPQSTSDAGSLPSTARIAIEAYRRPKDAVRLRALAALARIGRELPEARLALATASQDRDPQVRRLVAAALQNLEQTSDRHAASTSVLAGLDASALLADSV